MWNCYREELTDETNDANGLNKNVINSTSFKYKTSITGNTYNVDDDADGYDADKEGTKEVEIAVPLKCIIRFWRTLDIPLINCEVYLALSWSATCVITCIESRLTIAAQGTNPEKRYNSQTNATFDITDCKIYVSAVTLSAENDNNLLAQLKNRNNQLE